MIFLKFKYILKDQNIYKTMYKKNIINKYTMALYSNPNFLRMSVPYRYQYR